MGFHNSNLFQRSEVKIFYLLWPQKAPFSIKKSELHSIDKTVYLLIRDIDNLSMQVPNEPYYFTTLKRIFLIIDILPTP